MSSSSSSFPSTGRQSSVALFDVALSSLTSIPTLERSDITAYQEWKEKIEQWGLSVGVWDLITRDAKVMATEAVTFLTPYGFTPQQAETKYRALHQRVWGSLTASISAAMGSSLPNSIKAEQSKVATGATPVPFLAYNANVLWTRIKETYEKKAGSASITIFEELIALNYDRKTENPLQFKQRFESLLHKWNSVEGDKIKDGERISEGMKMALLIRALPRYFDTSIQAILSTTC